MTYTILLVEDEPYIRDLYQSVLSGAGYHVVTAENGRVGLDQAESVKPDIIFLDIMMPELNGVEMLKGLKSNPALAAIPVVMLTNLGEESIVKEAMRLGAVEYLVKMSLHPDDLIAHVKKHLP